MMELHKVKHVMLWTILVVVALVSTVVSEPKNVARGKPIVARLTCGINGSEAYFSHSQKYLVPSDRVESVCASITSHPASAMVDGTDVTWWQSTSRQNQLSNGYGHGGGPQSNISLDLLQEYTVESLSLKMQDSPRPGMIIFYKSLDGTKYVPWVYRVKEGIDCNLRFSMAPRAIPVTNDSAVCQPYTSAAAPKNEVILLDFQTVPQSLQEWKKTRHILIELYDMEETYNLLGNKFQHFTVSELMVMAECVCSDLSTGCILSDATGQYECVCSGNTKGRYCESCQGFYNQLPFTPGKPCEACNCFSHATACTYSEVTASLNMSLDANGVLRGGGVCTSCQHNTAGVNCEKCIQKYYRPVGISQTSASACVPCSCNMAGVQINPATNLLGDCVMNDDPPATPGKAPGDCFCKPNVVGSKCDQCKPGFFNLQSSNPNGCDSCYCDIAGTVAGNYVCETSADSAGQCPCKKFATNRQCNLCLDEYFGLSSNKTDGCSPCECDKGGSLNNVCNKESGQCVCRPNVGGRTCNEAKFGYYVAGLHFLGEEFTPTTGLPASSLTGFKGLGYITVPQNGKPEVQITIPSRTQLSNNYYLLLRYNAAQASQVTVSAGSITDPYRQYSEALASCLEWCFHRVGKDQNLKASFVSGEKVTVSVTVTSAAEVNLDEVVLVPEEFTEVSVLGTESTVFLSNSDPWTNTIKDTALYNKQMRTVGTYYLNGAQRCDCNSLGSYTNVTCEAFTGQCPCKPGVTGRRCDVCKLEFYGLGAEGCKPCECKSPNKVCNSITGACECPSNVRGRTCNECVPHSFNYNPVEGCTACNCNIKGSYFIQCNGTTGSCTCKTGVTGLKCDQCADGFANFNSAGCSPCNCNPAGSLDSSCNKTTGQCNCKSKVQGLKCDQCAAGTFYLAPGQRDGCLECVCMGVTKTCTSTSYKINQQSIPLYESTGDGTVNFGLTTLENSLDKVIEKTVVDDMPTLQTSLEAGTKDRYFVSTGDALIGNLVGSYGLNLSWNVHYISADSGIDYSDNKVVVDGMNGDRFFLPIGAVKRDEATSLSVRLRIEDMEDSTTAERGPFIRALSYGRLLIPASYTDAQHVVRISNIRLQEADALAVGDRAWPVEQCACGLGYSGSSCESCAAGYHRNGTAIDGFLSPCIGCECYKHADSCDSNTGVCLNCRDHTIGRNCEKCEDGYYGNPKVGTSQDCQPCPCFTPRVVNSTCALVDGAAKCSFCNPGYTGDRCDKCDTLYFGNPEVPGTGKCEPCFCNGNSQSCDPRTGTCLNCAGNTMGVQCEECMDTFYGNASLQQCTACDCNTQGSTTLTCDKASGNCTCHPGVTNRACDACLPNYYGFSDNTFPGCKACVCNEFGSTTQQCRDDGVCPCAENVNPASVKCDRCSPGFFGLPIQACQACACDASGSTDTICDLVNGQCPCKVGKAGRTCSVCDFMYELDPSTGQCTLCGDCPKILGDVAKSLTETGLQYWNETQKVGQVQELDATVIDLQGQINTTLQDLGASSETLDVLQTMSSGLSDIKTEVQDGLMPTLFTKNNNLEMLCQMLENRSQAELTRMEEYRSTANESLLLAQSLQTNVRSLENLLHSQVATASALVAQGNITSGTINLNFDADRDRAKIIAANITKTADDVQIYANTVQLQADSVGNATESIKAVGPRLDKLRTQLTSSKDTLSALAVRANTSATILNATLTNEAYGEGLLKEASDLLNYTQYMVEKAQQDLVKAQNDVAETQKILRGPVQELTSSPLSKNEYNLVSVEDGVAKMQQQIRDAQASLTALQTQVAEAGSVAQRLLNQSDSHLSEFRQVQSYGMQAVQCIDMLQEIINSVQSSQQVIIQADQMLANAIAGLGGKSATDIRAQAEAFREITDAQQEAVNSFITIPAALTTAISASNETLHTANATWNNLNNDLNTFLGGINNFPEKAGEFQVIEHIMETENHINSLQTDANAALVATNSQDPSIVAQERKVGEVQTLITNATRLHSDLRLLVGPFKETVTTGLGRTLNLTRNAQQETEAIRARLEASLAALEQKVAMASKKLVEMELPVRIKRDSKQVVTYVPQKSDVGSHTLVELEFMYTSKAEGLLFFMQDNATKQGLTVHMSENALQLSIYNGGETINVKSPVQLFAGSWFKVGASRENLYATISVAQMSTGRGVSTTSRGDALTNTQVAIGTEVHLGKMPWSAPQFQVGPGLFDGCINRVMVNGQKLDLWTPMVHSTSEANFCSGPGKPGNYPRRIPGITFSGTGHLVGHAVGLDFAVKSKLSIKMRTFRPDAVVFTIQGAEIKDFYGLFLKNGRLFFQYGTDSDDVSLTSDKIYNDGDWYIVTVEHNTTYAKMVVQPEAYLLTNKAPDDVQFRQFPPRAALALSSLISVGGILPDQIGFHGPTRAGFAGTMQNIQATVNSSSSLSVIDMKKLDVISQDDVDYDQAFMLVTQGIGFKESGYVEIKNIPSLVNVINFSFQTYHSTGILMYAHQKGTATPWFYVALFNGNLYVSLDQGFGIRGPLRTQSKFASDGLRYNVTIDFSTELKRAKLIFEGDEHVTNRPIVPGMLVGSVYLGGVPPGVNLPSYLPASSSFIGGISSLSFNSIPVDFFNPAHISGSNYDLSGIPGPPTVIPAPPIVVTPAPPVTPAPVCVGDPGIVYGKGVSFIKGVTPHLGPSLQSFAVLFNVSFIFTLEFRTYAPDGILLYASDGLTPRPKNYLSLFLRNGKLVFSMQSSSLHNRTKDLSLKKIYNNGLWHGVSVMRVNDFVVMVVPEQRDYINNRIFDVGPTYFNVTDKLYVGGVPSVPPDVFPFVKGSLDISIGNVPWTGCIRNIAVSVRASSVEPHVFGLEDEVSPKGSRRCFKDVYPGVYLDRPNSYFRALGPNGKKDFQIMNAGSFSFRIRFSTPVAKGIFLVAYVSTTNFILFDIHQEKLRLVLVNRYKLPMEVYPTVPFDVKRLCDNKPHELFVLFSGQTVQFTIDDGVANTVTLPESTLVYSAAPIYIGGIADSAWLFPDVEVDHAGSFNGCISLVSVNNEDISMFPEDFHSVKFECPAS